MTTPHSALRGPTHYDDVVGVEVTIDGMLVIADRLNLMDFPVALGIRLNIPQVELRNIVWEQVARDLTAQGVLDLFGEPHAEVAAMIDTLSRADRTLEGRWWRRDLGGKMVRFVVCRKLKGMREGVDPPTAARKELHGCRIPRPGMCLSPASIVDTMRPGVSYAATDSVRRQRGMLDRLPGDRGRARRRVLSPRPAVASRHAVVRPDLLRVPASPCLACPPDRDGPTRRRALRRDGHDPDDR